LTESHVDKFLRTIILTVTALYILEGLCYIPEHNSNWTINLNIHYCCVIFKNIIATGQ